MSLLGQGGELTEAYWDAHAQHMRDARLVFGGRLSCPFLRPLFMDARDEARQRAACEVVARVGERIIREAMQDETLLGAIRPVRCGASAGRDRPGLRVRQHGQSPGLVPPARLADVCRVQRRIAGRLRLHRDARGGVRAVADHGRASASTSTREPYPMMDAMLEALIASYRDWGGTARAPRIVITDFRGVPTWSEFEILAHRFTARGVPTLIADPRDLEIVNGRLVAYGQAVDLVYRRALMNDLVARPDDTRVLVQAYRDRLACVANTLPLQDPAQEVVLRGAHRRGARGTLQRRRARRHPRPRAVDARRRRAAHPHERRRRRRPDGVHSRPPRSAGAQADRRLRRPRRDARVGDRRRRPGTTALQGALAAPAGSWIVQERIPIRREPFPMVETRPAPRHRRATCWSTARPTSSAARCAASSPASARRGWPTSPAAAGRCRRSGSPRD